MDAKNVVKARFMEIAEEQAELLQSMAAIMESEHGVNLAKLINALTAGFKDAALFCDDKDEVLVHRGAVIGLNTLLSQVVEMSSRDAEIVGDAVKVSDLIPSYASNSLDDDEILDD